MSTRSMKVLCTQQAADCPLCRQGWQICTQIGPDWHQMGQICDFLRSVFCSFWRRGAKMNRKLILKSHIFVPFSADLPNWRLNLTSLMDAAPFKQMIKLQQLVHILQRQYHLCFPVFFVIQKQNVQWDFHFFLFLAFFNAL